MPTVRHKDPGQHDSSTVVTYTVIVKSSVSNSLRKVSSKFSLPNSGLIFDPSLTLVFYGDSVGKVHNFLKFAQFDHCT